MLRFRYWALGISGLIALLAFLSGCSRTGEADMSAKAAAPQATTVGTVPVQIQPMAQHLTLSSELVPFQEIDVYAKEAGYVKQLYVDYGSHVRSGQVMAVLEIPELEATLQQDEAEIQAQGDEVSRAQHEVNRVKAQHDVAHLQYGRLAGVAKKQPGLVAQQEVDDAQGRDLAAESQLAAAEGAYKAAQGQLAFAKARLVHDQALYAYSKIPAPFNGVVTQRYANKGALMQAGTTSNQATPLVRLSEEDLYRLVIPVPESDVKYVRVGDPVEVRVPSLNRSFEGKIARFSVDVTADTRTMHTEVDVPNPNPNSQLVPGLYAEAVLTLNQKGNALVIPVQALDQEGDHKTAMVVGPGNHVETRQILVGIQTPNYVEVASGLRQGEQVIVSDRSGLKAGQLVKPEPVQPLVYEAPQQ